LLLLGLKDPAEAACRTFVELNALYHAYLAWCERESLRPVSRSDFLEALNGICAHGEFRVRRQDEQVHIVGLKLAA
jgi:hypothetical protein